MTQIEPEVLRLLPREYMQRRRVVPLRLAGDTLIIAHDGSVSPKELQDAGTLLGREVLGELVDSATIDRHLHLQFGLGGRTFRDEQPSSGESHVLVRRTQVVERGSEDSAIVGFVADLLVQARRERATDIHLEPYEECVIVRFRVDGFLRQVHIAEAVFAAYPSIVSRLKVMAQLDIAEHRLPQDGRIKAVVEGEAFDFRVSILPTQYGESVNLRLLANTQDLTEMAALGLWPDEAREIEGMLDQPHGVILASGPTGSGKTTTLYAFLHRLNDPGRKILTIEDPTEYNLPGITQIEIRTAVGLSFASGLRSMLRHDPDIMMVGEIRDPETAETVIRVALTGHLVLSTVHTNDAPSTPARLLDMGVEPFLLSSCLNGIIAQRLVRRICPNCSEPDPEVYSAARLLVPERLFERVSHSFLRGVGCDQCYGTGFRGRTAIYEILPTSNRVRELIEARSSGISLARAALEEGYTPMRVRGLMAAGRGVTTVQEILRVTPACRQLTEP